MKLLRLKFNAYQLAFITGKQSSIAERRHCPRVCTQYLAACGRIKGLVAGLGEDEFPAFSQYNEGLPGEGDTACRHSTGLPFNFTAESIDAAQFGACFLTAVKPDQMSFKVNRRGIVAIEFLIVFPDWLE